MRQISRPEGISICSWSPRADAGLALFVHGAVQLIGAAFRQLRYSSERFQLSSIRREPHVTADASDSISFRLSALFAWISVRWHGRKRVASSSVFRSSFQRLAVTVCSRKAVRLPSNFSSGKIVLALRSAFGPKRARHLVHAAELPAQSDDTRTPARKQRRRRRFWAFQNFAAALPEAVRGRGRTCE